MIPILSLTEKMACRSPVSHLSLTCHHHGSVSVVVLPFETILTKRKNPGNLHFPGELITFSES